MVSRFPTISASHGQPAPVEHCWHRGDRQLGGDEEQEGVQ